MDFQFTYNAVILWQQFSAIPATVYFFAGLLVFLAFAFFVTYMARGFDGTFGVFLTRWGVANIVAGLLLIGIDSMYLFVLK